MSEQPGTHERLLTPEQVAERLSLSVLTVRAWLRSGRLPGAKPGGKVWRVREVDLDDYIRALSQGDGTRGTGTRATGTAASRTGAEAGTARAGDVNARAATGIPDLPPP